MLFVEDGHLHGVIVAPTAHGTAGEVEGVAHVAHGAEHVEVVASPVVGAVETVHNDGNGVFPRHLSRAVQDAVNVAVAILDP